MQAIFAGLRAWVFANRLEALFLLGLIGTIPAIASNSILAPLGQAESFGWSGVELLAGESPGVAWVSWLALLLLAVGFAFAIRHIEKIASGTDRALALLALLPLALLWLWCTMRIGSAMDYDYARVAVDGYATFPENSVLAAINNLLPDIPEISGAPGTFSFELSQRMVLDRKLLIIDAPYLISCSAVLLVYLWKFGFRRKGFYAILALSTAASLFWVNIDWFEQSPLVQTFSSHPAWVIAAAADMFAPPPVTLVPWLRINWLSDTFLWLMISAYPIVMLVLAAALARLLFRAVQDNAEVRQRFAKQKYPHTLRNRAWVALLHWLPFLAFVALTLWFNAKVADWSEDIAYGPLCTDLTVEVCPEAEKAVVLEPVLGTFRLPRDDLHNLAITKIDKAVSLVKDAELPSAKDYKEWRNLAIQKFDSIIHPSLEGYSPTFRVQGNCIQISLRKIRFSVSCLTNDLKNSVLNSLYQIPRRAARNAFVRAIDAAIGKAMQATVAVNEAVDVKSVKNAMIAAVEPLPLQVRKAIDTGFLVLALLSFAQLVLLIQAACRAYLTILARILIPPNSKQVQRERDYFAMPPQSPSGAKPVKYQFSTDQKLELVLAKGETLFVKHSLDVGNGHRSVALPVQPMASIVGRLLNRRYFLKRVSPNNNRNLNLTDIAGNRFVAMRLGAADEIAFTWSSFVGMTDNVKLGRMISLKLPMAAAGHIALPVARGPGLLVFKVRGQATMANRREEADAVAPYRLVAWSTDAWFRVFSSQNTVSIYADDCQLDLLDNDQAVIDVAQDGRYMPGLLRNLWALVRP